ncbi:FKBP-type peptidyl-prolyl cis-trans isomerase [Prauserella muralis]|uniref:Peptidyl-prolyl cis-trans isomerase n=1 Tax=Prauserella muralis TaxID=588067 RepID=A0A2V4AHT9_9PSEU|nr:FKBP-type peptidyl-prolyl cis-trans isomerase [Prauserella muralis]PXY19130.1 hypothetical protein BAY60_30465 [Prauserella muralis]TWE29039.1 FKBP-type peptidyl-prolyl isomerase-like protein [Prauserella muralis]
MRNAGKIMIVAAVATALAACSPSREEPSDAPPGGGPEHTPAPASVSTVPSESVDHESGTENAQSNACSVDDIGVDIGGEAPRVTIPRDCAAPSEVLFRDVEEGTGAGAEPPITVSVNYQVVAWSDGKVVENTFETEQPRELTLGQPHEIQGWDEGLADIQQGGTRLIVLPPDQGYGAQSGNPYADDTLVVVAKALKVDTTE